MTGDIREEALEFPASVVFDQAENRIHNRKGPEDRGKRAALTSSP